MVFGDVFVSYSRHVARRGHGHLEELLQRVVPVQPGDARVVGALQDRRPLDVRGVLHEGLLQANHAVGACESSSSRSINQTVVSREGVLRR